MMKIQKTTAAWVATGALGLSVVSGAAAAFADQKPSGLSAGRGVAAAAVTGEQANTGAKAANRADLGTRGTHAGAKAAAPQPNSAPSSTTANTPASPRTAVTANTPASSRTPVSAKSPVSPQSPVSAKSPVSPRTPNTPNSPRSAPSARSND
ncbi:MAG: hypothetical protein QM582_09310 [Micropruina sp.]|uniref:hypothetical protein n=1 Tax=Micropruina sp. TaxID=2737536 RepID=UPI0039E624D7